jgi:hypothetical protein
MKSAFVLLCVLAAPLGAQTPAPAPAPSIAGKWTLTSEASQSAPSALEIKLDDKKVTGTIVGANGTFTIAGEYAEGKLTFAMDYQGTLTIAFTGKLQPDGSLAGTMDYGQGPVGWKAVRVKDGSA